MDMTTFLSRLEDALRAPAGSIHEADRFQRFPQGWDSIGALSVIAMVDKSYGVTLDAGALWNCQTVGDLAKLAEGK